MTSAYGVHLVRVNERIEARDPPFEEVREAARREWLHARKVAANDAFYERLRSRYVIKVEAAPEQRQKACRGHAVTRLLARRLAPPGIAPARRRRMTCAPPISRSPRARRMSIPSSGKRRPWAGSGLPSTRRLPESAVEATPREGVFLTTPMSSGGPFVRQGLRRRDHCDRRSSREPNGRAGAHRETERRNQHDAAHGGRPLVRGSGIDRYRSRWPPPISGWASSTSSAASTICSSSWR